MSFIPLNVVHFTQQLARLSSPEKEVINSLTDLARSCSSHILKIVNEIENKLFFSRIFIEKISSLYLLDSIVKNIGGEVSL
jgi:hypothetical protein